MGNITPGAIHYFNGEKPHLKDGMTQGDVFYKTHIRIDTPTYQLNGRQNLGFQSDEDSQKFYSLWSKALIDMEIAFPDKSKEADKSEFGRSSAFTPDGRRIHMHPDDIVGYMTHDEVEKIQAYLKSPERNKSGSSLRWIDCHQVAEYINTEELDKRIKLEQDSIDDAVLDFFQTKQRKDYRDASIYNFHSMAPIIMAKVESLRVTTDHYSFDECFREKYQVKTYVKKLHDAFVQSFEKLKNDGRIIPHPTVMEAYRSLNKTEMKAWHAQKNREQKSQKKKTMGMMP